MATQTNGRDPEPGILVDSQIREAMDAGLLGIDPFNDDYLEPATYDLTIGKNCVLTTASQIIDLETQHTATIQPFSVAFIESNEVLTLDRKIVGRIGPKSSLLRQGIVASTGPQLDPGFRGRLFVTLVNFMDRPFFIEHKQPFLSVEFHALSRAPSKVYEGQYQNKLELSSGEINAIIGRGGPGFKEIHRDLLELTSLVKDVEVWGRELPGAFDEHKAILTKVAEQMKYTQSMPATIPITTLAPEPFELTREIPAVVHQMEDSYVASYFDANISTSGDTREEAVQNLKMLFVELFEDLEAESPEKLGPEPKRQLEVLRELMKRRN